LNAHTGLTQDGRIMKTLFRIGKPVLLVAAIVFGMALVAYGQHRKAAKAGGKVEIGDELVTLHPLVKLKLADKQRLDSVLANHSKSLYRIETRQNGKVTVQGTLAVTAALKDEAERANPGEDVVDIQSVNVTARPPTFIIGARAAAPDERAKLHQELKSILEKYR